MSRTRRATRAQREEADDALALSERIPSHAYAAASAVPAEPAASPLGPHVVPGSSSSSSSARRRYRICIVSDFFYPRLGGVELHQYSLAQALQRRGHKVVVVTGTYEDEGHKRQGVRHCTNGMKVRQHTRTTQVREVPHSPA